MTGLQKSDVCVIIPAYNEARHLAELLPKIKEKGFPVLVVDDGSTDHTVQTAKGLGTEVLASERNAGKGSTLRRGFAWALQKKFQAVILMDADGQHDPEDLELFLRALSQGRSPLILGNRMAHPAGMPFVRRATNRFMSWLLSRITRQEIPDSQCGYRALTRPLLEKLNLSSDHFEIESEMLIKAVRMRFDIGSIPVRCVYRGEKSHVRPLRDTQRFIKFLTNEFFAGRLKSDN